MVGEAGNGLACGVGCELGGGERRAPVGAFRGLVAKPPWLWVVGGVRGCGRWIGMLF